MMYTQSKMEAQRHREERKGESKSIGPPIDLRRCKSIGPPIDLRRCKSIGPPIDLLSLSLSLFLSFSLLLCVSVPPSSSVYTS